MSKMATKAADSVFYKARFQASKFNDRFSSREGAAEELGIDRTRLARIELGSIKPYPEEVLVMADIYNAPELRNIYCRNVCPLGGDIPEIKLSDLDRISIQALAALKKITETKENLLDIVADGKITPDERPKLNKIITNLDELNSVSQELKIWILKNL